MTLSDFLDWLAAAPAGTSLDASAVHVTLSSLAPSRPEASPPPRPDAPPPSWRERLWTAPPETRIGVSEVAEAIGRPRSFVYRRTGEKIAVGSSRLPHRKLDGELVFVVGEIRDWLRDQEEVVLPAARVPLTLTPKAS